MISASTPGEIARDAERVDWVSAVAALDACDGYVLVVVDPQTAEVDTYGPYDGLEAVGAAEDLRATLDAGGLEDVTVRVTRMHLPSPRVSDAPAPGGPVR